MSKTNPNQNLPIDQTLAIDQTLVRGKRLKRWLVWVISVLMFLVVVFLWGADDGTSSLPFKTQKVQRGNLTVTVTAIGALEPTNQVDVGSEISGTVDTVEVDYNDRVKTGQALARLDTDKLEAEVLQSQASLETAQAQLLTARATVSEARNEFKRLKQAQELSGGKFPSQHDLDAAQAELKRAEADEAGAKAQIAEAKATLDVNKSNLAKAVIRSPIGGIVLKRSIELGQTVAASFETPVMFTLAEDLAEMELHADVDEADVGQVREGQEATFTVDAYPDRIFPARITKVRYAPKTVSGVVTYKALLRVDNSDLLLRPGMTATADITVQAIENTLLVPNGALRFTPPAEEISEGSEDGEGRLGAILFGSPDSSKSRQNSANGDQHRVWTLQGGKPVAIPVTIGATNGNLTQVQSGNIEPGLSLLVDVIG